MHIDMSHITNIPQLFITWSFFFIGCFILFIVTVVRNRNLFSFKTFYKSCIPFDIMKSKSFHMDVKIYFIRKLTDIVSVLPGAAFVALVSSGVFVVLATLVKDHHPSPVTYWVTFASTIGMMLTNEFSDYLRHYLEHKVQFLWELHKVHHSADFLNPLTSKREHILGLVIEGVINGITNGITAGMLMFLFGFSLVEVLALTGFASKILTICSLDPLKHSHLPVGLGWFDRIFISPHMHQVHHSKVEAHWDKNFGTNLSIFDWLFGTGYKPKKGERIEFGISGYSDTSLQKFNTFLGAYITPVKRSSKSLLRLLGLAKPRKVEVNAKTSSDIRVDQTNPT